MKSIIVATVIFSILLLSQCSFFYKGEDALQKWQLNETPIRTELSVILERHKRELTGSNKDWFYLENGCSKRVQNTLGESRIIRQPGYMISGLLDTRLSFILPEYVFIRYCFDENQILYSVNINVEIDGI